MQQENCFEYDSSQNWLKWTGCESALKAFLLKLVELWENEDWQDGSHSHNLVTYKSSRAILKWHTSIDTVLIQGKDHMVFRKKSAWYFYKFP